MTTTAHDLAEVRERVEAMAADEDERAEYIWHVIEEAPENRPPRWAEEMRLNMDAARQRAADLRALSRFNAERGKGSFQDRVAPWMQECFGPVISADEVERGDRLVEEVFETLQSRGYDPARIAALRDYVWSRPVGETSQEVGGVMVTLAAFCLATGTDMHEAGEVELTRIWTKVPQIRAKQAAKPTGSTLPMIAAINPEVGNE